MCFMSNSISHAWCHSLVTVHDSSMMVPDIELSVQHSITTVRFYDMPALALLNCSSPVDSSVPYSLVSKNNNDSIMNTSVTRESTTVEVAIPRQYNHLFTRLI